MHKRTTLQELTLEGGGHENRKVEFLLPTEGCRNTDDQSLAFGAQLFGQIDLVPRRILNENIEIWDLITSTDQGRAGSMESRYLMK